MAVTSCYLCGELIAPNDASTSDHVVPSVLLGQKQPKIRGCDYGGRIPTHQTCNNHFSDENFFKQALHLVFLIESGGAHRPLQNAQDQDITILPVTPDQISSFSNRDFRRFKFIDTRAIDINQLRDPAFYADKRKVNLKQEAVYAVMTVLAKSAAALLVKRKLQYVPRDWQIYAALYDVSDFTGLDSLFDGVLPFDAHTRAAIRENAKDQWLISYQYKTLLMQFLFVFHEALVDVQKIFSVPGSDIHMFSGSSLNELLHFQWQPVK